MTDTIKLKKPTDMPSEFEDWRDLLDNLNPKCEELIENEKVRLIPLPKEEITEEIKESIERAKNMDPKDFIDIR